MLAACSSLTSLCIPAKRLHCSVSSSFQEVVSVNGSARHSCSKVDSKFQAGPGTLRRAVKHLCMIPLRQLA